MAHIKRTKASKKDRAVIKAGNDVAVDNLATSGDESTAGTVARAGSGVSEEEARARLEADLAPAKAAEARRSAALDARQKRVKQVDAEASRRRMGNKGKWAEIESKISKAEALKDINTTKEASGNVAPSAATMINAGPEQRAAAGRLKDMAKASENFIMASAGGDRGASRPIRPGDPLSPRRAARRAHMESNRAAFHSILAQHGAIPKLEIPCSVPGCGRTNFGATDCISAGNSGHTGDAASINVQRPRG